MQLSSTELGTRGVHANASGARSCYASAPPRRSSGQPPSCQRALCLCSRTALRRAAPRPPTPNRQRPTGLVPCRQLEYYRMPYMALFAMEDASVLPRPDLIGMGIGNEAGASSELPYAESYLGEFERGETTKSGAGHGPLRWVGSPQMGPLRLSLCRRSHAS